MRNGHRYVSITAQIRSKLSKICDNLPELRNSRLSDVRRACFRLRSCATTQTPVVQDVRGAKELAGDADRGKSQQGFPCILPCSSLRDRSAVETSSNPGSNEFHPELTAIGNVKHPWRDRKDYPAMI